MLQVPFLGVCPGVLRLDGGNAKCIIGFGFAVPKGLYKAMEQGNQHYSYTTLGVKYIDEEMAEIFLLKIGGVIENHGYDACLQKAIPNLRIKGDFAINQNAKLLHPDHQKLVVSEIIDHPGAGAKTFVFNSAEGKPLAYFRADQYYSPKENEGRHSDIVNDYIHPCCTFALSDMVIEVPGEFLK